MFAYSFGALLFEAIPGFWEIAKAESERPLPVILVPCEFVGKICTLLLVAVSWTLFVRQNEKTCVLNDFEIDNFKTLTRISCLALQKGRSTNQHPYTKPSKCEQWREERCGQTLQGMWMSMKPRTMLQDQMWMNMEQAKIYDYAARYQKWIAIFSNTNQPFCHCCGLMEKYKSVNEPGRDPIFHLLFSGSPARFLREHLKQYARIILGQSFDISLPSILFLEIPFHILKRCDKSSIRRWFSVVNAYKATMFSLYYRKMTYDRYGTSIVKCFNHHLRSIKKVAEERHSDIMDNIYLLPLRGDNVTPYYKIANDVFYDTLPL